MAAKELSNTLQDALDDLSSPRTTPECKTKALKTLERSVAMACIPSQSTQDLEDLMALQYTFECNIPLRVIGWIQSSIPILEGHLSKGSSDKSREAQATVLANQICVALFLMQGLVMKHNASKTYLGRRYPLEVLLDLLLASRHLSSSKDAESSSSPLSSSVLDTLLCILVDSPNALRAFERSSGIQAVVKILKRAGTPREVRMKCLEFLYFYLLDETPSGQTPDIRKLAKENIPVSPTMPNTPSRPATPRRPTKPYITNRPQRPSSRYGSSDFTNLSSSTSSRSTSGNSTQSSTSSSLASVSTAATSVPPSPAKRSSLILPDESAIISPRKSTKPAVQPLQPRSLMMLRKEVDYIPLSPKRNSTPTKATPMTPSRPAIPSGSRHTPNKSISKLYENGSEDDCRLLGLPYRGSPSINRDAEEKVAAWSSVKEPQSNLDIKLRTTEEKKQLLGTMLGNVDALVDGVRKAGIWGLN